MAPKLFILKNGIKIDGINILRPYFLIKNTYRNLRNRSIIIGFIGPRGSGKSTSAARTIVLEYLLKKRAVWSNMPVSVDLMLKQNNGWVPNTLSTNPIDKLDIVGLDRVFNHGCIFLDEVNQNYAEARRSQGQAALMFSYILQQIRKRDLDVIWTAQSEMHCESRLRWQTDVIIKCEDCSINTGNVGVGELSRWKIFDYSGLVRGQTQTSLLKEQPTILIKPWWNVFDTSQLQIGDGAEPEYQEYQDDATIAEIAKFIQGKGKVQKNIIWAKWRIKDFKTRRNIMDALLVDYCIRTDNSIRNLIYDKDLEGVPA